MRAPPDPTQLPLFAEVVETIWTRDTVFDNASEGWGLLTGRPTGKGWQPLPLKHQRERHTGWQRRRPVFLAPRRASRGGGGWLK
ncbi:hypothetical protein [Mesorhizobium sp.]|uniref:hypothetical protein n=1 Tax=Mesorhizobium sp. TaxID=1871066 RepID=UPI000FE965A3|nr:hypothetical protein [Mesorhizobium sp.]RWO55394.1 MAG: hypothetical protein EOS14_30115 [Mesorhizobium sp.]